jgi:tetraacyldisaccharide 4'-kinase
VGLFDSAGQEESLDALRGRAVVGFCGLGNPEAFRQTLLDLGAEVRDFVTYPDHHPYTRQDVEELARRAATLPSDGILVTTQKDLVKLRVPQVGDRSLRALRIRLHLEDGAEVLHRRLDDLLTSERTPQP